MREPALYYRENVGGGIALLEAMREAGVNRLVISSTAAVYGVPDVEPDPRGRAAPPDQPLRRDEAGPRGRRRLVSPGATGSASRRCATSTSPAPRERNGERHDPETHLIPNVLERGRRRRRRSRIFGADYPTPDGTRDPRLRPRPRPRRGASPGARGDRARRRPNRRAAHLQPRQRRRLQRARGARRGRAVIGRSRAAHRRPAPGRRPAVAGRVDRTRARGPRLGAERSTLDEMIGSAWAWRDRASARRRPATTLERSRRWRSRSSP